MKRSGYLVLLIIATSACKKPYAPPAIASSGSYLVVEGVINSGSDSTIIKLSRTVNVSSKVTLNPVLDATLTVESDQNAVYPLTGAANGMYISPHLNLDNSHQYRLRIKTADNKEYLSDFTPVKITPPIDSVGFNILNTPETGIEIYTSTHDPNNATHYYRWDYSEAWEFNAKYASNYVTDGTLIRFRQPNELISVCYSNDVSSDIVLGSSAKLTKDVIYQNPTVFISSTSEKIEDEYSVLVHQYALTTDAYNFWVSLKKNTEQLGSIFDAEPTQLQGNIHGVTNPAEPVIGFVSVCTVSSKRIFIYNAALPNWVPTYPYTCQLDSELYCGHPDPSCHNDVLMNLVPIGSPLIPTEAIGAGINPLGFLASTPECVDCTLRGTKKPPPFWK